MSEPADGPDAPLLARYGAGPHGGYRRAIGAHRTDGLGGPSRGYLFTVALLAGTASMPILTAISAGSATVGRTALPDTRTPFIPTPSVGPVVISAAGQPALASARPVPSPPWPAGGGVRRTRERAMPARPGAPSAYPTRAPAPRAGGRGPAPSAGAAAPASLPRRSPSPSPSPSPTCSPSAVVRPLPLPSTVVPLPAPRASVPRTPAPAASHRPPPRRLPLPMPSAAVPGSGGATAFAGPAEVGPPQAPPVGAGSSWLSIDVSPVPLPSPQRTPVPLGESVVGDADGPSGEPDGEWREWTVPARPAAGVAAGAAGPDQP